MAFHHRKLLLGPDTKPEEKSGPVKKPGDDKEYESACYNCYSCPDECYKYLPPQPPPPSASNHPHSSTLILTLSILGPVFLFLSYLTIRRYLSSWRNSRRRSSPGLENDNLREDFIDELQGPVVDHPIWYIRTVGLPQSVIDSITMFKYKKDQGLTEETDCSVCLSEFQEDESIRLLPKCSHAFHGPCIDTWLRSHKNCPVCRAPVSSEAPGSTDSGSRVENQMESVPETLPELGSDEQGETRNVCENISELPVEDNHLAEVLSNDCRHNDTRNGDFRIQSDLADRRVGMDQELQPVRRSVSLDFSSASTIYANVRAQTDEGCRGSKVMTEKQDSDVSVKRRSRSRYSSSYLCSLRKGPVSMKRSFSFSGKCLFQ
ncbi:RING-H2 finger protein ATL52-like [Sesamum indicum]|uniref:RING-type E3 ubiquitin transferase n=1 Tax=Sesamum indicum TaxID=4182 RepID=A0A6I9UXX4_SESIN|nr:RING-H2 finger protein ATL52-like [Sesamum indicum]